MEINLSELEDFIKSYKRFQAQIGILKDTLESIEVVGLSAIDLSKVGRSSDIFRPTEELAEDSIEVKQEIEDKIFIAQKKIDIIDNSLSSLNKLERNVIRLNLIEQKGYQAICNVLHISDRYVRTIKKQSLKKIADNISPALIELDKKEGDENDGETVRGSSPNSGETGN